MKRIKTESYKIQGICAVEGCTNKQTSKGRGKYSRFCASHRQPNRIGNSFRVKKKNLKTYCVLCGPEIIYHPCQLDIDHKDGNRNNNNISNLQTLCANCHRLKTFNQQDYLNKYLSN